MSIMPSARSSCGPTPTALIEQYGQDVNEYDMNTGMTVLHSVLADKYQCLFGHVRRLCEAYVPVASGPPRYRAINIDLPTLTNRKETALHMASRLYSNEIFLYLLQKCHANPIIRDGSGNNAFAIVLAVPPEGTQKTIEWLKMVCTIYTELIRPTMSHEDEFAALSASSSSSSFSSFFAQSTFSHSEFDAGRKMDHGLLDVREAIDAYMYSISDARYAARTQSDYEQFKSLVESTMQVDLKIQAHSLTPSLIAYQRNLALALNEVIEQKLDHPSQQYPLTIFNSIHREVQTSLYPSHDGAGGFDQTAQAARADIALGLPSIISF